MRTREQNAGAQIAYDMAYFALPRRAHADPEELRADFEDSPDLVALDYFRQAAKNRVAQPDEQDLRALRGHIVQLDTERDCLVIEYPKFPAVDLLTTPDALSPDAGPYVLAPYFSAVVIDRDTREVRYFVLGQSPDARTTLREVSPQMNTNLGPGCKPELVALLELLRQRFK
jgi:hypothetical protein